MRRVIKVGGSLLSHGDLVGTLPRWISQQSGPAQNLVVIGGGEVVDAIRHLDRLRPIDPGETHWICVELLETTFRIAASWFGWPRIESAERFCDAARDGFPLDSPTLISVRSFYHRRQNIPLPTDWRTTTDAIAAWMAIQVNADELVLLKSCRVDPTASLEQLAEQGVVDEALPTLQSQLKTVRVEQLKLH